MSRSTSLFQLSMQRLKRRPAAWGALVVLGLLGLTSLLTPFLPLERPDRTRTSLGHQPPQTSGEQEFWIRDALPDDLARAKLWPWDRVLVAARDGVFGDRALPPLFGRDSLGRCLLSRLCWGSRVSLAVGLFAALVSLLIGVSYGAVSGYFGGRIDNIMMRTVDVFYGIPFIFVVIFLITMMRGFASERDATSGLNVIVFFLVIGLVYWLTMARVVRGQVVSLRQQEFVASARALGASPFGILRRHIVPNLLSIIIVYLTLTIPRVMLFEAFISFLGLGVEAPDVSWGVLAREAFDVLNPVRIMWWLVLWPSLALAITLSALNVLGDCLRDAFDPKAAR